MPSLHLQVECVLLQAEAALMKAVMSGGKPTKIVVVAIGESVNENEVNAIASSPTRYNVIRVPDYTSLNSVHDRVLEALGCPGK